MTNEQGDQPERPSRPLWTLTEAATHCKVSRSTIRRYREQGKFPNAVKSPDRGWLVPVEDLLGAGLSPGRSIPEETTPTEPAQADSAHVQALEKDLIEVRSALNIERAHREAAERIAAERERGLTDLRAAMRMLEAARPPEPEETQQPAPAEPEPTRASEPQAEKPKKRRGWRSWFLGE